MACATGLPPNAHLALVWRSGDPHRRTEAAKFFGIAAPDAFPVANARLHGDSADRDLAALGSAPHADRDYGDGLGYRFIKLAGIGYAPHAAIVLTWETYVRNRLSGNGWNTEEWPLANVTDDAGGAFT